MIPMLTPRVGGLSTSVHRASMGQRASYDCSVGSDAATVSLAAKFRSIHMADKLLVIAYEGA